MGLHHIRPSADHVAPRLYGRRWDKARKAHLEQHPWCVFCEKAGRLSRATVVDHIKPHRQDPVLFWDETNWQGLCEHCHNSIKQAVEKGRSVVIHGLDGYPCVEVSADGVTTYTRGGGGRTLEAG